MKVRFTLSGRFCVIALCGVMLCAAIPASGQTVRIKANNATALNAAGSWIGGVVPGTNEIAQWDYPLNGGAALGADATWGQIRQLNPNGNNDAINASGIAALTLNGLSGLGIDMRGANQPLAINCYLKLGNPQAWDTANTLTVKGPLNNNGKTLTLFNNITTLSCMISGNGGITAHNWQGVVTLSGTNTYTGATTVAGPNTVLLDFTAATAPANNIVNNGGNFSALVFEGPGTLQVKGKVGATITQQFNGLTVNRGGAVVSNNVNGASQTISLGAITHNNNASVDFLRAAAGPITTTTPGFLGPWATVDWALDFATNSAGTITGLNAPVIAEGSWVDGRDYSCNTSGTLALTASHSLNTLRSINNTNTPTSIDLGVGGSFNLTLNALLNGPRNYRLNTPSGTGCPVTIKRTAGSGTVVIGPSGNLYIGGSGNDSWATFPTHFNFTVPISGNGNVVKIGPDGLLLTQTSTFTGNLILNGGGLFSNTALGFGSTNNVIVLQGGGSFGWYNANSAGTFYRFAHYSGMIWAADFSFRDPVNGAGILDFNGVPVTIVGGTRMVDSAYPGVLLDGVINDGSNGYGITVRSTGALWLLGQNTYSGPTTITAGTIYADKGRGIQNSNFVLQGGALAPAFNPDLGLTLGTGAGQLQFVPGLNASLTASPYCYADVNLNSGAPLTMNSTAYFLRGGNAKTITFNSSNNHGVVWKNPIQVTPPGWTNTTLTVTGNAGGGYDGMLVGDLTQNATTPATLTCGGGVIVYAGQGNYYQLQGAAGGTIIPTRATGVPAVRGNFAYIIAPRAGAADEWASADVNTLMGSGSGNLSDGSHNSVNFGVDVGAAPFTCAINTLNNGGGARTFTKYGMGKLILSGAANYTGATTIKNGILGLNAANNISGTLTFTTGARLDNVSGGSIDLVGKTVTLVPAGGYNYFGGNGDIQMPTGMSFTPGQTQRGWFANLGTGEVKFPNLTTGTGSSWSMDIFAGANMFDYTDGVGLGSGKFRVSGFTCNIGAGNTLYVILLGPTITLDATTAISSGSLTHVLAAGKLVMDYSADTTSKVGTTLQIGGGELLMKGHASTAVSETTAFSLGSSWATEGPARITLQPVNGGGNLTLTFGALTRTVNANGQQPTIDFNPVTAGATVPTIKTTAGNATTTGIIGPWASFQRDTWAYSSGTTPFTIAGRSAFDLTDKWAGVGTTNNVNITTDYNADPGVAVNQNTVRIAAGKNVTFTASRTFTAGGVMVRGGSDSDTTFTSPATLSPGYLWVNSTNVAGTAYGRFTVNAPLANALVVKAGPGILRLCQPSANASYFNLNEGTVELAGDNVLGTGGNGLSANTQNNLWLGDFSGQSGFAAVSGPRTIQNSTFTSTGQYGGGLRGVRFSGTNDMTIVGAWQGPDASSGTATILTMDDSCNVVFQGGASTTNRPGILVVGDTNGGTLIITGNGSGTLRFANPVQRAVSGGNAGGSFNLQRSSGVVQLDQGTGIANVNVNKGVLVTKGTSYAPIDRQKILAAHTAQDNHITVPETTGLAVGMALQSAADSSVGCYITGIAGNVLTMNRLMTGTETVASNWNPTFQGIGPAGTRQTYVAPMGVLGLGANIAVPPTLTSLSCGTIGIETNAYTQNLDMAGCGNGEMYLGSATAGTITGGTLLPGIHNTYRLGGGGGTLAIGAANALTGAAGVMLGSTNLFKGATSTVIFGADQNYTGDTLVNAGQLTINGNLTGAGALHSAMVIGNGNVTLNGQATLKDLTFTGTGKLTVPGLDGLSHYLRVEQANYSLADAQADIAAGRIVSSAHHALVPLTENIGGTLYTMIRDSQGTLLTIK